MRADAKLDEKMNQSSVSLPDNGKPSWTLDVVEQVRLYKPLSACAAQAEQYDRSMCTFHLASCPICASSLSSQTKSLSCAIVLYQVLYHHHSKVGQGALSLPHTSPFYNAPLTNFV